LTIDVAASLRRIKPDKRRGSLSPRPAHAIVHAAAVARPTELVVDTNVYIRSFANTLPPAVEALVDQSLLFHCSVCVAELTAGIANADPAHAGWESLRDHYVALIERFPESRILTADAEIWTEAGLISGTLARTQNHQRHQRKECLNDALIFLTAAKAGVPVLTSNRVEFDLIQQLAGRGRFVYY
jgi:predicted nucleic acid-binding protein